MIMFERFFPLFLLFSSECAREFLPSSHFLRAVVYTHSAARSKTKAERNATKCYMVFEIEYEPKKSVVGFTWLDAVGVEKWIVNTHTHTSN